jgi:hypothetical protein
MNIKGKITILTKKEFTDLINYLKSDCNGRGKKNAKILEKKYHQGIKKLNLKTHKIAIINENVNIAGYLLWLQALVKDHKTCEIFASMKVKSFFIIN